MQNWAVDLHRVRKTYGKNLYALKGVDIQVGRGEIFGLLGPNGAGKSTLVKIMMTVVRPDEVQGTILGGRLGDRRAKERIGYLPEALRFSGYLTGGQVLDYFGMLGLLPRKTRRQQTARLLERLSMTEWRDTPISQYSKGMLQRLGLAQALINSPDLVVLDEPTDGLDPIGRRDVRQLLVELKNEGKTVFLNSHQLSELEMVCDRVAILDRGEVVRHGRLGELAAKISGYQIKTGLSVSHLKEPLAVLEAAIDGDTVSVKTQDIAKVNAVIDLLRGRGILIQSVTQMRLTLEDIFVEAMNAKLAAAPVARQAAKENPPQ